MSFEIQELPDIIRIIILINLSKGTALKKSLLKRQIDKVCSSYVCLEMSDLDRALDEMTSEGLILTHDDAVQLTEKGIRLGTEWKNLLLKKDPILEVVAGLTDGSITGLVVILSAFIATYAHPLVINPATFAFAAILTLAAVAITNFSSFLLGGITEDLADMITLQTLIDYSLSDIPDKKERSKSLLLVKQLFTVLHAEISKSNLFAAVICGTTTFLAGSIPIMAYLLLPEPFDIILSLSMVSTIVGVFLVRYRSRKTKVHWKVTLFETIVIVAIAVVASLIVGSV